MWNFDKDSLAKVVAVPKKGGTNLIDELLKELCKVSRNEGENLKELFHTGKKDTNIFHGSLLKKEMKEERLLLTI